MSLKPEIGPADQTQGNEQAAVKLVEYGDYQCPYCRDAYSIVKNIQSTFGDQILFVFRNFPLQEAHRYANIASQAAEAAGKQGKFWEMHDAIFENQDQLNEDFLDTLAEKLGLDREQFEWDLNSEEISTKVENDFESGVRSGVNGTPSFFINGTKFDGGADDLLQVLKESGS
ncbi:MAG: DsbA family protein [Pedobacter sp.]